MKIFIRILTILRLYFFITSIFLHSQDLDFLERIKNEFNKKNYRNVINLFESEIGNAKKKIEVNYYVALSYYYLKEYNKAENIFEDIIYRWNVENPSLVRDSVRFLVDIYSINKEPDKTIKLGEYIIGKFKEKKEFSDLIIFLKERISNIYIERGNNFYYAKNYEKSIENFLKSVEYNPQNYVIKQRLGEAFYNIGKYEDAKKYLEDVLKNEKNNWYIIVLAIDIYRKTASSGERKNLYESLEKNSISFKIFDSFEKFMNSKYDEGYEILMDEEEKRKSEGNITYNIIIRLFPFDWNYHEIYLKFINLYPSFSYNQSIINSLFNNISDEKLRRELEKKILNLLDELKVDEKVKENIIRLKIYTIDKSFERRLVSLEDYKEKMERFKEILPTTSSSKLREEILRKILEICLQIEDNRMILDLYKTLAEEFKKEEYYFKLAEYYFKLNDFDAAENIIKNYLNLENENYLILLAKIFFEKNNLEETNKIIEKLKDTKSRFIQKEIENLKNMMFEIKDMPYKNFVYFIYRRLEDYSTRVIPENESIFLNQNTEEIEFYLVSEIEDIKFFSLRYEVTGPEYSSFPNVLVNYLGTEKYFEWSGKIKIDNEKIKKKNLYRVLTSVKEVISPDFELRFEKKEGDEKFILIFEFNFKSESWMISINNYKNYGNPVRIEPKSFSSEGNNISWEINSKFFRIEIEYVKNPDILLYFPSITLRKIIRNELELEKVESLNIGNFKLQIKDFYPEKIRIFEEINKTYNFKEYFYRVS